jgi:hypothetical protein
MKTLYCFFLSLLLAGCGSGSDTDPAFGWQLGGCVGQEQALTEGEGMVDDCEPEKLVPEEPDYCNRTLYWKYSGGLLQLVDFPVALNCCGIRSVRYELVGDTYTITEVDRPEDDGTRCRCMCDTSYSVCISNLPQTPTKFRLLLQVAEQGPEPVEVWQGSLDLAAGGGQIGLGPSGSLNCI